MNEIAGQSRRCFSILVGLTVLISLPHS